MKKTLILAAVAVVAMASCAKNEVIAPSTSSAIGFDTFVGNSTKATAVETFDVNDVMKVMAFYTGTVDFNALSASTTPTTTKLHIDNKDVTKTNATTWTYTPLAYWPKATKEKISFFANSIGAGAVNFNDASGDELNVISFEYTNPTTAANQKDLMIASLFDKTNNAGKLKFDFKHALSQLKFTFIDGTKNEDNPITVNQVVVTYGAGFFSKGTFTFSNTTASTGSWSATATPQAPETFTIADADGKLTVDYTGVEPAATAIKPIDPIMLIPQGTNANAGINVAVTYTVGGVTNTVESALVMPKDSSDNPTGFEQAKIYTYAVSIGLNAIEFGEPTITDDGWADGTNNNVQI